MEPQFLYLYGRPNVVTYITKVWERKSNYKAFNRSLNMRVWHGFVKKYGGLKIKIKLNMILLKNMPILMETSRQQWDQLIGKYIIY